MRRPKIIRPFIDEAGVLRPTPTEILAMRAQERDDKAKK